VEVIESSRSGRHPYIYYVPCCCGGRRLTSQGGLGTHEILCGVEGAGGIVPGRKIRYGGGSVTVAAEDGSVSGWVVGPGTAARLRSLAGAPAVGLGGCGAARHRSRPA
jgi:hypothetical protein